MSRSFTILILEDSDDRIEAFHRAIHALGPEYQLKLWHDAPTMLAECQEHFQETGIISLDHDLIPRSARIEDPGTGLVVVRHLSTLSPVSPVILHSSSETCRRQMHQELQYAGWRSEMIAPQGVNWIETRWLARVRSLLKHPDQRS